MTQQILGHGPGIYWGQSGLNGEKPNYLIIDENFTELYSWGNHATYGYVTISGIDIYINNNSIVQLNSSHRTTTSGNPHQLNFLDLTDTPSSYINHANKFIKVDSTGNSIEFVSSSQNTISWGTISGTLSDQQDLQTVLNDKATINHTIDSHDTSATGAELTALTDGSNADNLHNHTTETFLFEFDNASLVSNILTVNHSLNRLPVSILIYDPNHNIIGSSINATSTEITVNFGSAIDNGTWTLTAF